MKPIILASTSPRRKELLKLLGLDFEIIPSDFEEDMALKLEPARLAAHLSKGKAKAVAQKLKQGIVIGADTVVVLGNRIIGKPRDAQHAGKILKKLSGKVHNVITGFTIINISTRKTIVRSITTKVWFKRLTEKEIRDYVKSGEPLDKAGAYAVQGKGAALIKRIEGDYFNVVGLPLCELSLALKKITQK